MPVVVNLAAAPMGLAFFSGSTCTSPTSAATIPAGQTQVTVFFRASTPNTYNLTASAAGLVSAVQPATVRLDPDSLVFTTTFPASVRGGTCLAATLEARRQGVPITLATSATVGLTTSPTGGTRFYSDATCTQQIVSTVIASGQASSTFFVKPLTRGTNVMTATASFGSDSQAIDVLPIVRRGTCTISSPSATCPISAAQQSLGQTLLFTQARGTGNTHVTVMPRCRLLSPTSIECRRYGGAGAGSTLVHWQTVEIPQGLAVRSIWDSTCAPSQSLSPPIDPTKSFVLKSIEPAGNNNFDDDDTLAARIVGPGLLSVQGTNTCAGYAVQVAEWQGVNVTRAALDGGMATGQSVIGESLPPASSSQLVLVQGRTSANGSLATCGLSLRGDLPSASAVEVSRGTGACANVPVEGVVAERIDLGALATVQQVTVTLTDGQSSQTVLITPVDITRTLVISSAQQAGGQGTGSNDSASAEARDISAHLELTAFDRVTVTRGGANGNLTLTFYVVELTP